jgi:hypothetical protein
VNIHERRIAPKYQTTDYCGIRVPWNANSDEKAHLLAQSCRKVQPSSSQQTNNLILLLLAFLIGWDIGN